jgi:hypothetical protein
MVCPSDSCLRQKLPGKFPKTALHPVADDRAANFFGDGIAHANLRGGILPIADKQNEAAKGSPFSRIGGQKI